MRNPDGTLNGDLNDNIPAYVSGTIGRVSLSTTNENETVYDLLPVFINKPPVIINPISEASTPPIKPYATADATGDAMYLFPDGTVKVKVGATFTFRLRAEQPSIFNVENGIPTMLPPNQGLKFVWRKDGNIVTSYTNNTLRSVLTVNDSELTFTNIQPEHAGSYICEVQNDIGTTSSETINLEILNLDFDEYFYRNLVKNPYGKNGTDEWEASSEDFIARQFTDIPSQELKRPNRIDLFGYTHDMMHPRPYQIDYGVLKGFNMTEDLVLNKGTYFATDRFRFAERGGTTIVRAFQDIDLTDIEPLIKGGVFGVEGVRAIFSCYIGNAVSDYLPVQEIVNLSLRTNPKYYSLRDPRLSVENVLLAGPPGGLVQNVEVYVEEYDNDTRLSSKILYYTQQGDPQISIVPNRVVVRDPWIGNNGEIWKWLDPNIDIKVYPDINAPTKGLPSIYPTDIYGVGPCNNRFLSMLMLRGRELVPNNTERYTYGQYISFNKVILERLNPKTTKVRITLSFNHEHSRIFDAWRDGFESSDEVFEVGNWSFPQVRNTWLNTWQTNQNTATSIPLILAAQDKKTNGQDLKQFMRAAEDPRGLVTAINFALLPVLTQESTTTIQQTNSVFALNNTPAAFVPDVLTGFGRPFDPTGVRTARLKVYFSFSSKLETDATGLLRNSDQLIVNFDALYPNVQGATPIQATTNGLFPFIDRSTIMVESIDDLNTLQISEPDNVKREALKRYTKYRYLPQYNQPNTINNVLPNYTQSFNSASLDMTRYGYMIDSGDVRIPSADLDVGVEWNGKSRFYGAFALYGTGSNTVRPTMLLNNRSVGLPEYDYTNTLSEERANTFTIIGYYMDFDFSDPNNTKVRFWRDKRNTYPPEESYSQINPTRSFDIPHTIDQQGRLICTLSGSIITTPMDNGGMGYELIKDILDPDIVNRTGVISGTDDSGTGVRGNGKAVVRVSGTPKDCVTALRVNIKPFSLPSEITSNTYYTRLINEIIDPVRDEIDRITQIVQPQADDLLRRDALRILTGSLRDYAISSGNSYNSTADTINQTLNDEFQSTLVIDLTEEAFTNRATFNSLYSYSYGTNILYTRRQTLFPPHLLNLRADAAESAISLITMRAVDPLLFNDNIGSPSYGKFDDNQDYVVVYAPLRDSVAGTYL